MRHTYFTVKPVGTGDITSSLTDATVAAMMPSINQMMVEKILPMVMIGLIAGAISAAAIGSWFATRRTSGTRRNPWRRRYA